MYDLLIRGATVVDGLGRDPRRADVAISNSRIAATGESGGAEVIDAGGLALMPGIIDIHTHYDAQVTWDPTLSPSPRRASPVHSPENFQTSDFLILGSFPPISH
jgi:N-acyl-D-aspartate/D-glutamate deacylase